MSFLRVTHKLQSAPTFDQKAYSHATSEFRHLSELINRQQSKYVARDELFNFLLQLSPMILAKILIKRHSGKMGLEILFNLFSWKTEPSYRKAAIKKLVQIIDRASAEAINDKINRKPDRLKIIIKTFLNNYPELSLAAMEVFLNKINVVISDQTVQDVFIKKYYKKLITDLNQIQELDILTNLLKKCSTYTKDTLSIHLDNYIYQLLQMHPSEHAKIIPFLKEINVAGLLNVHSLSSFDKFLINYFPAILQVNKTVRPIYLLQILKQCSYFTLQNTFMYDGHCNNLKLIFKIANQETLEQLPKLLGPFTLGTIIQDMFLNEKMDIEKLEASLRSWIENNIFLSYKPVTDVKLPIDPKQFIEQTCKKLMSLFNIVMDPKKFFISNPAECMKLLNEIIPNAQEMTVLRNKDKEYFQDNYLKLNTNLKIIFEITKTNSDLIRFNSAVKDMISRISEASMHSSKMKLQDSSCYEAKTVSIEFRR